MGQRVPRYERGRPFLVAIALTIVNACGSSSESDRFDRAGFGGVGGGPLPPKAGCPAFSDRDSDGIPDSIEGLVVIGTCPPIPI